MPFILPVPTIDHVAINARDALNEAATLYRRLGFTLTPRGHHTLGSINHLAMFGTDYLELIGVPPGKTDRYDLLQYPKGLFACAFAAEESDTLYSRLIAASVPAEPPLDFARTVHLPGGARDAMFHTVGLSQRATPVGRIYFCEHLTPALVWRDEWRTHANGVIAIRSTVIEAARPDSLAELLARMFGPRHVVPIRGGHRLVQGLGQLDIVTPAEITHRYGQAAPQPDGRSERMVALELRTISLDAASAALVSGGIGHARAEDAVIVPAAAALGVTVVFLE